MEHIQEHFLESEINLVQASTGKRFANYILDLISFYLLVFIVFTILSFIRPELVDFIANSEGGLLDTIAWLVMFGIFMGSLEALLKGKTPGKYLTRTRAVNEDGTPITAGIAFKRGFIRVIPFCAFSAFGSPCYPWQDKWTNTYVIDEKLSILGREA